MVKFLDWLFNSRDVGVFFIGFFLNEALTKLVRHDWIGAGLSLFFVVANWFFLREKD